VKHLLVPIDFSNDSIHALEFAIMIANRLGLNIRLIHVKRKNADFNASFNINDFDEVIKSGITDNFEKLIGLYGPQLKGQFDYRIREGRIYGEICNQAKYGDSELIVMGTHGVSGFEERWVGSNAFRVVSNAACPVITIRYDFPHRPISRIVLPIDITNETRQKVPFVAELALIFKAEVHVIDIRENNKALTLKKLNEYTTQVMSYLKRKEIRCVRDSLKGKSLADISIEYSLMCDADLVAIMIEQNEKSHSLWLGAYAQKMVNHSPTPVISFRPY